jgi:hypothetical protein
MNYEALPILMALTLISDMVASLVVGIRLLSFRNGSQNQLVTLLALVFFGIFLRGLFHLIAEGFSHGHSLSVAYESIYWFGRMCLTVPCWIICIYLLRNPHTPVVKDSETKGTL